MESQQYFESHNCTVSKVSKNRQSTIFRRGRNKYTGGYTVLFMTLLWSVSTKTFFVMFLVHNVTDCFFHDIQFLLIFTWCAWTRWRKLKSCTWLLNLGFDTFCRFQLFGKNWFVLNHSLFTQGIGSLLWYNCLWVNMSLFYRIYGCHWRRRRHRCMLDATDVDMAFQRSQLGNHTRYAERSFQDYRYGIVPLFSENVLCGQFMFFEDMTRNLGKRVSKNTLLSILLKTNSSWQRYDKKWLRLQSRRW